MVRTGLLQGNEILFFYLNCHLNELEHTYGYVNSHGFGLLLNARWKMKQKGMQYFDASCFSM